MNFTNTLYEKSYSGESISSNLKAFEKRRLNNQNSLECFKDPTKLGSAMDLLKENHKSKSLERTI